MLSNTSHRCNPAAACAVRSIAYMKFIEEFLDSPVRTEDPSEANLFFIPMFLYSYSSNTGVGSEFDRLLCFHCCRYRCLPRACSAGAHVPPTHAPADLPLPCLQSSTSTTRWTTSSTTTPSGTATTGATTST